MKFGAGQAFKPTPTSIIHWVLIIAFLCTFTRTHLLSHLTHSDSIQHEIDFWLGVTNEFIIGICPLFGVNVGNQKMVPVGNVSAMDDPGEKKNVAKVIIWFVLVGILSYL